MKNFWFSVLTVTILLLIATNHSMANSWPRTGIGFRASYADIVNKAQWISVHGTESDINLGAYGGSIFFYSQIRDQFFMEFTLGAIGSVHNRTDYWDQEEVNTAAIIPVLFGVRYEILPSTIKSTLRPYVSAAVGPYWLNEIMVYNDHYFDEEVTIDTSIRPGGYAGAGVNFMLSKNVAINYDMRYHVVDFQDERYHNGFELGIGLTILWGDYQQ